MKLVVLGSGTCAPSRARNSAGYWVEGGSVRLRLDCGAGTMHAMAQRGLPWEALTHQFISHFHIDHVGELPALLFAFKNGRSAPRQDPLTLVGPVGLNALVRALSQAYQYELGAQDFPLDMVELTPGDALRLSSDARLKVWKTPHTPESLAVRFEAEGRSIGYTGDTAPSDDLVRFFSGVDVLIAECSFVEDGHGTRHLAADDAANLAKRARARHLVATHLYFDAEKERLAERLARSYEGRITIASDGATFTL